MTLVVVRVKVDKVEHRGECFTYGQEIIIEPSEARDLVRKKEVYVVKQLSDGDSIKVETR